MTTTLPAPSPALLGGVADQVPAPSVPELPSLDSAPLGPRPWTWRKRWVDHGAKLAEQEAARRIATVEKYLAGSPPAEVEAVRALVRTSLVTTTCTSPRTGILDNRWTLLTVWAVLCSALPALAAALAVGPPIGFWPRLALIAIALAAPMVLVVWLVRSPAAADRWLVPALSAGSVTSLGIATLPAMWPAAPSWSRWPPVHLGMEVAAWTLGPLALAVILMLAFASLHATRSASANRRRHPEAYLVNVLAHVVHELPDADDARSTYLDELDDGACAVERHWPAASAARVVARTDEQTELARQIAAAVRARHLPVSIGALDPIEARDWPAVVLAALASKDLEFFRLFEAAEDSTQDVAAAWRRFGRGALICGLAVLAAALLVVAVGQPGLPDLVRGAGWPSIATWLTLADPKLQASLVTGAFGLVQVILLLAKSRTKAQAEGSGPQGHGLGQRGRDAVHRRR